MNDRELLELAAKAIGLRYDEMTDCSSDDGIIWEQWNPLNDDALALRLAVKLGINIMLKGANKTFAFVSATCDGNFVPEETDEDMDIESATRRAIVRAAASIGKDMP